MRAEQVEVEIAEISESQKVLNGVLSIAKYSYALVLVGWVLDVNFEADNIFVLLFVVGQLFLLGLLVVPKSWKNILYPLSAATILLAGKHHIPHDFGVGDHSTFALFDFLPLIAAGAGLLFLVMIDKIKESQLISCMAKSRPLVFCAVIITLVCMLLTQFSPWLYPILLISVMLSGAFNARHQAHKNEDRQTLSIFFDYLIFSLFLQPTLIWLVVMVL